MGETTRAHSRGAAFLGIFQRAAERMTPAELWALQKGDALRWSRTAELVAWAVWMICCCMPFSSLPDDKRRYLAFVKEYMPPGFIPPNQRD